MKILILLVATVIIACDAFSPHRKNCPTNCIALFDPVCGSDGETYSNSCYLEVQKCLTDDSTLTEVPCRETRSAEECPEMCTKQYDPVCGSDQVTYSNQCEFLKAQCQDSTLKLKGRGECDRIGKRSAEECPEMCTKQYDPVCGSDQVTYSNQCEFLKAQCQDSTLKLKGRGECDRIEKRRAEYCPDICTMQYDPVCGSNGVVYNNQCEFWKAKCRNPSLILKGRGECDRIDFYCDGPCFGLYEPQCGSDGRMYTNKCTFMKQQICHNPDLTLGTNC